MKLSQKIKHVKRHRANKRFAKYADDIHFAAAESFLNGNGNMFIISPKLYYVISNRRGYIPKNIINSWLCDNDRIITVPSEVYNFYNDNVASYIKEWAGIPNLHKHPDEETVKELDNIPLGQFVNPELYKYIDKPIAPDIATLNGVRV
jgi:hypothetical protein